jgi:hypothetical protein
MTVLVFEMEVYHGECTAKSRVQKVCGQFQCDGD